MELVTLSEPAIRPPLPPVHIEVRFGSAIRGDAQGRALFALERYLRETVGVPAEVFKETAKDDLARRRDMTQEQRDNL